MPVPSFIHEMDLDAELNIRSSSAVTKKIFEKYQQLSFSIDQKMIAARYFLGCLEAADFVILNEALNSSDPNRPIDHIITYGMPSVYCEFSLHAKAKPAYQFLLNLLVDGVLANLVGITDVLGKVVAELYGFSPQKPAKYLHTVRDYMVNSHSTSPVSAYLKNNYPDNNIDPFHWLNILKRIRNELEHQDICDIGSMRAEQLFGGYRATSQVTLYLNTRFFQSGVSDDERDVLKFANGVEKRMESFVDDIYQLLVQEVKVHGVPL